MGYKKYMRESFRTEESKEAQKKRLIQWRRQPVNKRVENPTRPDKAKQYGYKSKNGVFVVRHRTLRGGRQRPQFKAGRRSAHRGRRKVLDKSYQEVAENRVAQRYVNCEVLGSYRVGKDGNYFWHEVVLADPNHGQVKADDELNSRVARRKQSERGLTSSGKKSRGMRK
jgi:large subunit ribosomal protein L15e